MSIFYFSATALPMREAFEPPRFAAKKSNRKFFKIFLQNIVQMFDIPFDRWYDYQAIVQRDTTVTADEVTKDRFPGV